MIRKLLARGSALWSWFLILRDDLVFWLVACCNSLTPSNLKWMFAAMLLYVISPIDILPEYLPLFGVADDIGLMTLVFYYMNRKLPPQVKQETDLAVYKLKKRLPYFFAAFAILCIVWIVVLGQMLYKLFIN